MRTLFLQVFGIVQGVGFRPFIHRLAMDHHFKGTVANKGSLVEITLQTDHPEPYIKEQAFILDLKLKAPERSLIMDLKQSILDLAPCPDFKIIESANEVGDIFVSPDIAICETCQQELLDPHNRRYLHPFINCTACGPRLTILKAMPYDRERTSMHRFKMCPECYYEYTTSSTRRYDAQPVCCNDCGPEIFLLDSDLKGLSALSFIRKALLEDAIVAIKGLGGFHLCCQAYSEKAVAKLRERKHRPTKPLAIMFKDLETLKAECEVSFEEAELLSGWQKPIVLLKKKNESKLAYNLAPYNSRLGAMLPYTPLHLLLFKLQDQNPELKALVMTSANISGVPICRTTKEAKQDLQGLADFILTHNRKILLRADDSVTYVDHGKSYVLRRSRGYAPLPLKVEGNFKGSVVGMGAELKNTFCLAQNGFFYLSPHIGDLGDLRTLEALISSYKHLCELLRIKPQKVACDRHPHYNSRKIAQELDLPVIEVQHHYAHILACMAEHNWQKPLLGLALDGTGFGLDGSIWGGELLLASLDGFERLGSLSPFPHTGGDIATKEVYRLALSLLQHLYGTDKALSLSQDLKISDLKAAKIQILLTERGLNTVKTTSCGRLFDAVSCLLGLGKMASFEGEAACKLQFVAEQGLKSERFKDFKMAYDLSQILSHGSQDLDLLKTEDRLLLPLKPLIDILIEARLTGMPPKVLALYFHHYLAQGLATMCAEAGRKTNIRTCALSGGVFQNSLMQRLCVQYLTERGFKVLVHTKVPANDGGLALGQALAAAYNLNQEV
ncbi:MAG: carbamoyltransferase HypF [Desulfovibrionaceae bacterium]|nr:carbamoyltransferase HypF [Desulfovibrionaceae bacterium]